MRPSRTHIIWTYKAKSGFVLDDDQANEEVNAVFSKAKHANEIKGVVALPLPDGSPDNQNTKPIKMDRPVRCLLIAECAPLAG